MPTGTLEDLGNLVKQKYPEYQDMDSADLGKRVQAKYPGYEDFVPAQSSGLPDDPGAPDAPAVASGAPAPRPQPLSLPGPGAGSPSASGFNMPATLALPPGYRQGLFTPNESNRRLSAAYDAELKRQADLYMLQQIEAQARRIGLTDPTAIANFVNKHPANPSPITKYEPGTVGYQQSPSGEFIKAGQGEPRVVETPEGGTSTLVPNRASSSIPGQSPNRLQSPPDTPTPTAAPTAAPGATPSTPPSSSPSPALITPPDSNIIASSPPRLSGEEANMLASAQRVATAFGLPFDPNKNPRNPLLQLPAQAQRIAQIDANPMLQYQIDNMKEMRELRKLREVEVRNQLDVFNQTRSPQAISKLTDLIKESPDSFKTVIDPNMRAMVAQDLKARYGLNPPRELPPAIKANEEAAQLASNHVEALKAVLSDPVTGPLIRKRLGTWSGRAGDLEQSIGSTVGLSKEAAERIQAFRYQVNALFTQELKANLGSRPAQALAAGIKAASPNMTMGEAMFLGALQGVENSNNITLQTADNYRWSRQATPPPVPSSGKGGGDWQTKAANAKEGEIVDTPKGKARKVRGGYVLVQP